MLACINNLFHKFIINVGRKMAETRDLFISLLKTNLDYSERIRQLKDAVEIKNAQIAALKKDKRDAERWQKWACSLFSKIDKKLHDNRNTIFESNTINTQSSSIQRLMELKQFKAHDWNIALLNDEQVLSMGDQIVNNNPALNQLPGLSKS